MTCECPAIRPRVLLRGHFPADGRRRCEICGCLLAHDRPASAERCSAHDGGRPYSPRADGQLEQRVLALLEAARGKGIPVNLAARLGTADRNAIWHAVRRLRRQGMEIVGIPGYGYYLP